MRIPEVDTDSELQKVLWACYWYWQTEPLAPQERVICYTWVVKPYRGRFSVEFHRSRLERLAKLGFLEKYDTSRGGSRRYYRIADPERVDALVRKWSLN